MPALTLSSPPVVHAPAPRGGLAATLVGVGAVRPANGSGTGGWLVLGFGVALAFEPFANPPTMLISSLTVTALESMSMALASQSEFTKMPPPMTFSFALLSRSSEAQSLG